jgi:hypothetical protein
MMKGWHSMKKTLLLIIVLLMFLLPACSQSQGQPASLQQLAPEHWAYNEILDLHNKGLIENIDSTYQPDDMIARSEFINMLLSVLVSPDVVYIKGELFDSQELITRDDAIYITTTALKLRDNASDFKFADVSYSLISSKPISIFPRK